MESRKRLKKLIQNIISTPTDNVERKSESIVQLIEYIAYMEKKTK